MMPDVTNQADKEPGLLWTDTQLWVQLCAVVRPEREREGQRNSRRGKKRNTGREKKRLHGLKMIYLEKSGDFSNTSSTLLPCHTRQTLSLYFQMLYTLLLPFFLLLFLPHLLCLSSSLVPRPVLFNTLARYPVLKQLQPKSNHHEELCRCSELQIWRYYTNQIWRDGGGEEWEKPLL